jgi:hypothetical protein
VSILASCVSFSDFKSIKIIQKQFYSKKLKKILIVLLLSTVVALGSSMYGCDSGGCGDSDDNPSTNPGNRLIQETIRVRPPLAITRGR